MLLFKRYIWLLDLIHRSGGITLEEIQDKWLRSRLNEDGFSLPRRTFHDHKLAVEELFDVDIECRTPGYRYYIAEGGDLRLEGAKRWMLEAFAVQQSLIDCAPLRDQIMLEHTPSGAIWLTDILESMQSGRAVEVTYRNFFKEKSSTFVLESYGLRLFQRRWYLVASNPYMDNMVRLYSLDRIESLVLTEQEYVIPEGFSLEEYFGDQFGIVFSDVEPKVVKIKTDKVHARYLQALPIHASQQVVEEAEEYTIFKYYVKPTYDFCQALIAMGTHMVVLSPQSVRDKVLRELEEIAKLYK